MWTRRGVLPWTRPGGLDPEGNELFKGGKLNPPLEQNTNFESEEHSIVVGDNPNPSSPCKDKEGKFKWNPKSNKKRNCAWIAKKNKRCKKKLNGEQLWRICPKSCNRCDDL